jgi:hypothetical protein
MKTIAITFILITTFFVGNAQSNYYWSGGQQIWLDTDSTQMIIQFDSEYNMQTFTSVPNVTKLSGKGLSLVSVQPASDSIIQTINTTTSIINKIYETVLTPRPRRYPAAAPINKGATKTTLTN